MNRLSRFSYSTHFREKSHLAQRLSVGLNNYTFLKVRVHSVRFCIQTTRVPTWM